MSDSLELRVEWSELTAMLFSPQGFNVPFPVSQRLHIKGPKAPLTIEDIADWIEARVEGIYFQRMRGKDQAQAEVRAICLVSSPKKPLPWDDSADRHLKSGDTVVVDCMLAPQSMLQPKLQPTEEQLKNIRASLRLGLGDRVLCHCGPRWFSGHIVGTAAPDEDGDILPYLVKTDPLPGLPSRTISVPSDMDEICMQEICFDPSSHLLLVKAAAQIFKESARPKLRFEVGERVVVRIHNSRQDGLEQWVAGTVGSVWPKLEGELVWQIEGQSGAYPDVVPYKVDFPNGSWVYCHRDNFTLIRREGMQPQTRVKGISKRMEVIRAADGRRQQVDHQTERRKNLLDDNFGDEDSD